MLAINECVGEVTFSGQRCKGNVEEVNVKQVGLLVSKRERMTFTMINKKIDFIRFLLI